MNVAKTIGIAFIVWLCAVWQQSAFGATVFLGLRPEPLLVLCIVVSLRTRPAYSALVGFTAGLLEGGGAGANMTGYCLSRTIVSFACAFVARSGLSLNPLSTGGITAAMTVVAQILLLFLAPPPDIGRFLGATIGTAIYNGVLAGLIDAILRRTLEKQVD